MIAAWLVHLYTASGIVLAFLAARAIVDFDYRTAFFWLWLQVVVDATDGVLARRFRVRERIPWFDGAKLDDIADYLTYVFVPALFVWRGAIVPTAWALPVAAAMLLSSAYGFNRTDAKTADHFFTGFPSVLECGDLLPADRGLVVRRQRGDPGGAGGAGLRPIRYVYPSRTPHWRVTTNVAGVVWGAMMLMMLWQYPAVSRQLFFISLAFPVYYVVLSLVLHFRLARPDASA